MLHQLPNAITLSRLLLALPLGLLILREQYYWALGVGFFAGVTDALDGLAARRLNAQSQLGAILDPLADKALITVSFLCFATTELIPWYLAAVVITRDLVIMAGAACYYKLIGPFEFSATGLSKANMFIQICFCVLVLAAQVLPVPQVALLAGTAAVIFIAAASGFNYIMSWSIKALQARSADERL